MKFVVTGGAGFVGTNLIKRLLSDGHEVLSVDNYSTGKKENHIASVGDNDNVNYIQNDISDIDTYKDMPIENGIIKLKTKLRSCR